MKKLILSGLVLCLVVSVFAQESFIEQSLVINIEVPVRVFKGDTFIPNLTLADFELLEDGVPQKIEAVYLVKKRSIERSDENKRFKPETGRYFFLFFEVSDYTARIGEALDYLFQDVILPGDNLFVVTPLKSYQMRKQALELKTKEEISEEIKGVLRKDTMTGNSEYRSTVRDIATLAKSLQAAMQAGTLGTEDPEIIPAQMDGYSSSFAGLDMDDQLVLYQALLGKLDVLRQVDQLKMLDFAKYLKMKAGQKYVFLFHQEEFVPRIEERILSQFINEYGNRPDIVQTIMGITDFYRRDSHLDVDLIKKSYADSSISMHFLYITRPPQNIYGVDMESRSEDIYNSFSQMAKATGGFIESSANPVVSFKKAVDASENYYLLYYTPKKYAGDGKFKNLQVSVKGQKYRVLHRAGYFSN
ncbi:hypothetical protein ACFLT9_13215 [Acidobacteriota bacterium]